jgi:hypothetical protein
MRITAYKALSATQRQFVLDACAQRNVDCEITDGGPWIRVKLQGESDAVTAAWAAIRAARNEAVV